MKKRRNFKGSLMALLFPNNGDLENDFNHKKSALTEIVTHLVNFEN